MSLRRLLWVLTLWSAALCVLSLALFFSVRLNHQRVPRGPYVVSLWRRGERVARKVLPQTRAAAQVLRREAAKQGGERVSEQVVDLAPIGPAWRLLLAASLAPSQDGLSVDFRGRTAYATPLDLRKLEAYEAPVRVGPFSLILGVDLDKVLSALGQELHATPTELLEEGSFHRFAVLSDAEYPKHLAANDITPAALRSSIEAAAGYLVRNQHPDGTFRYEVSAMTLDEDHSYNYPRHAGATYFLARAANQFQNSELRGAARRAGAFIREHGTLQCGAHQCIGEGDQVDVGSAALALLADVELLAGGDTEYRAPALDLAAFLRSQQRNDGEFQHLYSIREQRPIDVQLEYYTGEAAFALARVARVSGDVRDLEAARRALSFLVTRAPWFLGARYFWGAEHWTCQALEELWERAPDPTALDFCLRWQAANRRAQFDSPPAPPEYDGAVSRGPFLAPRLTPLASRMEAAVATLAVARKAGLPKAELAELELEIRRGFAFLLNNQFSPGPAFLMRDRQQMAGGFPGSPVDLHVRIDYPQHAAGALLRYWELARK